MAERLEGPELAVLGRDLERLGRRADRGSGLRPRCTLLDPLGQERDLGGGQLALGRHLGAVVGVVDRLDEQAGLGVAGHDDGAAVAALHHQRTGVEAELGLLLVGAVALEAVGDEDGADRFLEELDLGGRGFLVLGLRMRRQQRPTARQYEEWNQSA